MAGNNTPKYFMGAAILFPAPIFASVGFSRYGYWE